MAYTYGSWTTALSSAAVTTAVDADFTAILPSVIDYAEQRIYRDLDLLATVVRDESAFVAASHRDFVLPSSLGRFVVVKAVNIVTPIGSTVANGTRNPLTLTSLEYIDFTWPSEVASSATAIPSWFAMVTDQSIVMAPSPGAAFAVEVIGTIRPTPLSAANTTTFLSSYLPDLFFAASMIFVSGWQKNFGSQADDPRMAMSWETQYKTLLSSAQSEVLRKKYAASFGSAPAKTG